jgi:hypothetical protein
MRACRGPLQAETPRNREQAEVCMPAVLLDRESDVHAPEPARDLPRARRRRLPLRLLGAAAGLAVLVAGAEGASGLLPSWENPVREQVVDHSTPPLLLALADLHQYHAATGSFQVVVDEERNTRYVPTAISGRHTQLLATGSVDAYVDFSDLGPERISTSADRRQVTLALPAARLGAATVDPGASRVLDRDRGLVQRVGALVGEDRTDDSRLYGLAEQKLAAAATGSDLAARAQQNTRDMLTSLAHSFGFEKVTVTFADGR